MDGFLFLAFVFLCAAVLAVPIASRLGLGSVLGYLIAGIVIAPLLAAIEVDVIAIQHFAEFGVVMMLFLVGLELEPRMLWAMRVRLIGLGGLQVGLTALAIMALAIALGQPWSVSLAIGLVLALSSTAIVLQSLNEKGLMKSDGGQGSFSVLLFQDIAVIPMLALMPFLAMPALLEGMTGNAVDSHDNAENHSMSLIEGLVAWQQLLVTLAAVAAVVIAGRLLLRPLFDFIARIHLREIFVAAALLWVIAIALLMILVGLSPALGTFLAGVVLADSEYRHELESNIEPFKGLLLGLFFITVGASINFPLLLDNVGLIIGLTVGLMLVKAVVLMILAYIFKIEGAYKWLFALGLAQAGEFGFVLLSFTVANAIIPEALADKLLLIVALSMLLTPLLFIVYDKIIAPRFIKQHEGEMDKDMPEGEIIIAGHGRFGGVVNMMLRGLGFEPTVVDYSSEQLEMLRAFEVPVYFGDATRPDLLHAAGIENARLLVIAIDGREHITELVRYVRQNYPKVHIVSRAVDRNHVYELYAAGCQDIIRETFDSSVRTGRSVLVALGMHPFEAERRCQQYQQLDRYALRELASVFDAEIPIHKNEKFMEKYRKIREENFSMMRGKERSYGADSDTGWVPPDVG